MSMTLKAPALLSLLLLPTALADQFDGVREKIKAGLDQHNVASIAVAVAKDGEIIWEEGFGWADRERKVRATEHTLYSLASISKPITATGLMTLVEQGRIDLDKPVNDYLGEVKLKGYAGDASGATVAAVASHTAGLPLHYQFFLEGEDYARPSMDETLRKYGILVTAPGERYQYSNLGFGILDYLIERAAGKPYPEYMREAVFKPLGLEHMAIPVSGADLDASREWAVRYWNAETPLPFYDFDHRGGSAVYSCAHDLVRFALFHLGKAEKPILEKRSLERMRKPIAHTGPGRRYGLGWAIEESRMGVRVVSHNGGMGGVATSLAFAPEAGLAVVVLANAGASLPHDISHEIFAVLLPEYARKLKESRSAQANAGSPSAEVPNELRGAWTGHVQTYQARLPLTLEIGKEPGSAKASLAGKPAVALRNLRLQDGYLTAEMDGDIGVPDANRREYALHFSLRPRGEVLNGALSAIGKPSPKLPNALTSWVELRRGK